MARTPRRTGKPTSRKRAGRKPAAKPGRGHNKPPPESDVPPPTLPNMGWYTDDQTAWQVARDAAARHRAHIATISNQPVGPPFALAHDPNVLHDAMLRRIAAIDELTGRLLPEGQIEARPLDARDIDEISSELATLKTLPPRPAQRPAKAIGAQRKLRRLGEKVLQGLVVAEAKDAITEASKTLWANYGDRLLDLAHAIGDWLANLPGP
jgi:hypothetical protein